MICKNCGTEVITGRFCQKCGSPVEVQPAPVQDTSSMTQGMSFDFSGGATQATPAGNSVQYEYKVLSQKDKWFSGKFDPALLEQAMNSYAKQGWRVLCCATADIPGFSGPRQEFITVLEREVR